MAGLKTLLKRRDQLMDKICQLDDYTMSFNVVGMYSNVFKKFYLNSLNF